MKCVFCDCKADEGFEPYCAKCENELADLQCKEGDEDED